LQWNPWIDENSSCIIMGSFRTAEIDHNDLYDDGQGTNENRIDFYAQADEYCLTYSATKHGRSVYIADSCSNMK
jgi:hypothetical protein